MSDLEYEISQSQILFDHFDEIHILRCPKCYLIPFISLDTSNKIPNLNFECLNNHIINKPLEVLYNESKNYQINTIKCKKCDERDISKIYYCNNCFGFFCEKELHNKIEGHEILIPINKFDNSCIEKFHGNDFVNSFCKKHFQNICNKCKQEKHIYDNIEDFTLLSNDFINNLRNNIKISQNNILKLGKKVENLIFILKKLSEDIKNEFIFFKNKNEIELSLADDLINIYEKKKQENCLNYQIIQNVKNLIFKNINFDFNIDLISKTKEILISQFQSNAIELKNKTRKDFEKEIDNFILISNSISNANISKWSLKKIKF